MRQDPKNSTSINSFNCHNLEIHVLFFSPTLQMRKLKNREFRLFAKWQVPKPTVRPRWSGVGNHCSNPTSGSLLLVAAAAAKLLQSCPSLCDPIDGSPPGSAVPWILYARTLEWVAISFSSEWKWSRSVVSDLSDPMDCSAPGSSIHGILQARVLEWGAIAFSYILSQLSPIICYYYIFFLL